MKKLEEIHIPTVNDFQSIFGCDCYFDEHLNQVCEFYDNRKRYLSLAFSDITLTFSLTLLEGDEEIISIYDEHLQEVRIDQDKELILIKLKTGKSVQNLSIKIWPTIIITYSCFKNN